MNAALPAILRPSTILHALRANVSAEPKMIFVYLLLLVVPWVVWQGHRTGEPDHLDAEESSGEEEASGARGPSAEERKRLARKRRPGHMNWVQ